MADSHKLNYCVVLAMDNIAPSIGLLCLQGEIEDRDPHFWKTSWSLFDMISLSGAHDMFCYFKAGEGVVVHVKPSIL
jgi:hypothetical protein